MSVTIRPAIGSDDHAICALSRRLYDEHPSVVPMTDEKVRATLAHFRLRPERGSAWVACEGEVILGFVFVATFWSNEYGGEAWILDELSVDPARRGAGVGAALLAHVEHEARRSAARALVLELDEGNPARRLYERTGWAPARREVYRRLLA